MSYRICIAVDFAFPQEFYIFPIVLIRAKALDIVKSTGRFRYIFVVLDGTNALMTALAATKSTQNFITNTSLLHYFVILIVDLFKEGLVFFNCSYLKEEILVGFHTRNKNTKNTHKPKEQYESFSYLTVELLFLQLTNFRCFRSCSPLSCVAQQFVSKKFFYSFLHKILIEICKPR